MEDRGYNDNYSEGCKSCQAGKWLCIFLTYLCNAKCNFCPSPFKQQDKIFSAFGDQPDVIFQYMKEVRFNGISFSGGDCFLVFNRLLKWVTEFKLKFPDIYYWAYTNGLAADDDKLKQLADNGLNEIRFNIAATGYNSALILKRIETAVMLFDKVAVEIPSIPADYEKLITVLPVLDSIGVSYLNLHEFMLMPEDPLTGKTQQAEYILNKESVVHYDPQSLSNTRRVIKFCRSKHFNIRINNCSLQKKDHQMLQRRLAMGRIFRKPYEKLTEDGLLKTWLVYSSQFSEEDVHSRLRHKTTPEHWEKYCITPDSSCNGHRVDELVFLPPLGIDDQRVLYQINKIR